MRVDGYILVPKRDYLQAEELLTTQPQNYHNQVSKLLKDAPTYTDPKEFLAEDESVPAISYKLHGKVMALCEGKNGE